jgi:hypothetical protein
VGYHQIVAPTRNTTGAVLMLVLGLVIFGAYAIRFGFQANISTAIVWSLTVWCLITAARLRTIPINVSSVLADNKPFVLYLRSFDADSSGYTRGIHFSPFVKVDIFTYEQRLAVAFQQAYKFVAVGRPGERLPELGADRLYLEDAEWKEKVDAMLHSARLVVIAIGKSSGLSWEIDRVLKLPDPTRIVFFMQPPERGKKEEYRDSLSALRSVLPKQLSGEVAKSVFVCFGAQWEPRLIVPQLSVLERCVTFNAKRYRVDVAISMLIRDASLGLAQPKFLSGDPKVRTAIVVSGTLIWLGLVTAVVVFTR